MSSEQVATQIVTEYKKDPKILAGSVSQLHKEGSMPLRQTPVMTSSMFDQRQSSSVQTERLSRTGPD